jgi:hypothetical protein
MSWDCAVAVADKNVKNVTAINLPINNVSLNYQRHARSLPAWQYVLQAAFRYLIVGIFLRKGGFSLSGLACGATIGNSPTISPGTQHINRFCG